MFDLYEALLLVKSDHKVLISYLNLHNLLQTNGFTFCELSFFIITMFFVLVAELYKFIVINLLENFLV